MTISTPLPSPTDPAAHYQRLYARYQAGQVYGEIIAPKIAGGRIGAGDVVMYVFAAVGEGKSNTVQLWAVGQGRPCGVALATAADGEGVRVLMWAMVKEGHGTN
jgi:hypothetical protein